MRARIVEKLAWLGAVLDPQANAAGAASIAGRDSRIGLHVVRTDEELMIARHTFALLAARGGQRHSLEFCRFIRRGDENADRGWRVRQMAAADHQGVRDAVGPDRRADDRRRPCRRSGGGLVPTERRFLRRRLRLPHVRAMLGIARRRLQPLRAESELRGRLAGARATAPLVPETVTLPLCSRTNASPFWIMLLLVWGGSEHGMAQATTGRAGTATHTVPPVPPD
jgi:hypothetical protein